MTVDGTGIRKTAGDIHSWSSGSQTQTGQFALADAIDSLCDDFERAWKEGVRPAPEAYLRCIPPAGQVELLQHLLPLDFEYRAKRGDRPRLSEYLAMFPQHARLVQQLLDAELSVPGSARPERRRASEMQAALQHLPAEQREAVRLRHLEGWSLQLLAEHFGRSESSVARLLKIGMKTLRRSMVKS